MAVYKIFSLVTLFSLIFCETQIDKLSIIEGQGFIIHLKVPQNFGQIRNCWYKVQNEEKTLIDLHSTEPHERETGELITPYNQNICGIRVIGVPLAATGNWMLEAENDKGQIINHSTVLSISNKLQLGANREIITKPGRTTISCSEFPLRRSCRISNQRNGRLHDTCEMADMIRNKTIYKCSLLIWGSMFEIDETITVEIDKSRVKTTEANLIENYQYLLMNCQFSKKIGNCRAEYPDKIKQIYIRDGFSSDRISAFDTDLENGKCVLEIQKPLKNNEIGIWKIVSDDAKIMSGCLFYVHKNDTDKNQLIQMEIDKSPKDQTIEIVNRTERNLKFTCTAPFVLEYCYLRDPKNQIHIPSIHDFQETRMLGQCHFENVPKISGEWICGMAGKENDDEIIQKFNVIVLENGGKAINKSVLRIPGQSIEMLCQTTEREPMTECAFIDPKGNVYLLSNEFDAKNKSRFQYFGDGLEYGDCGLTITNLMENEFGYWTCVIGTSVNQYSYKINIKEPKIDQAVANSIGIGFSAFAIVLLMGGLFYYRRKHTQNTRQDEEHSNEIEEENPTDVTMTSRL